MADATKKMKERLFGAEQGEPGSEIADAILGRYRRQAARVIAIIQDLQAEFGNDVESYIAFKQADANDQVRWHNRDNEVNRAHRFCA